MKLGIWDMLSRLQYPTEAFKKRKKKKKEFGHVCIWKELEK